MGVQGLTSLLQAELALHFPPQELPVGTLLLIDGNGWAWHLLAQIPACRQDLGDYDSINRALRDAVRPTTVLAVLARPYRWMQLD